MSCTEIYAFKRNGEAYHVADVTNAWRGAMAVWNTMDKRYLPQDALGNLLGLNRMEKVWKLADKKDIPTHERIVLFTTFDNCLVKKENLPKVIEAFYNFDGDTSLPEQAGVLERILDNEEYIAVGWNQNSINGDTWDNRGGYDPETEVEFPYNCLTMDEHFWLFDELDNNAWVE